MMHDIDPYLQAALTRTRSSGARDSIFQTRYNMLLITLYPTPW